MNRNICIPVAGATTSTIGIVMRLRIGDIGGGRHQSVRSATASICRHGGSGGDDGGKRVGEHRVSYM